MGSDVWIVLQWWGSLFLVGAVAWPLTKRLFAGWFDEGYLFSKAVGMAVVTWIVYVTGTLRVMPFSTISISFSLSALFLLGLFLNRKNQQSDHNFALWRSIVILLTEELFFFMALLFWSWVKAHEPSIRGLEKFMDFGFMQSILNARFFPPADMWYAGSPINYYYFGHLVTTILTKLSGLDLAYTFNLMLATIFALTLTMSYSIGYQLICHSRESGNPENTKDGSPIRSGMTNILAGLLTAFLVTLGGNMQTIYAFTRGYTGENVKPFWELLWPVGEFWKRLPEGFNTYWYANATRFIPFTIHEFPGYSFVVSDVHGHVLSIPFVLLAIALLVTMSLRGAPSTRGDAAIPIKQRLQRPRNGLAMTQVIFYGFLVGVLLMTNALDGPIYFALFAIFLLFNSPSPPLILRGGRGELPRRLGELLLVVTVALLTSAPFLFHFKSFVSGLAVNCPLPFLANSKIGPIIFEGVEKCQISPLWMWWLLWGFFLYCGAWLIFRHRTQKLLIIFFLFALGLVIFPEFFYFKDIYPAHFRSNTMFKLGYDAFILFSIISGYTIVKLFHKKLFFILLIPQLILVSIFPIFAVRSYFGGLKNYEGIYGLNWLAREYQDDFAAITWIRDTSTHERMNASRFTLVEADGDSYTDYARFSAFTGNPTIIGWAVHEWLWRGTYDVVAPRREEVRQMYESADLELIRTILVKYGVRYIIVGKLEREKYKKMQEWKFRQLGREAFRSADTVIYETY